VTLPDYVRHSYIYVNAHLFPFGQRNGVTPVFSAPDPLNPGISALESLLLGPNAPVDFSLKPELIRPAPPLYLVGNHPDMIRQFRNFIFV
jgi:hypothetical protein